MQTQKTKTEKQLQAGVFVDASNTYFSEKRAGWKIDYQKLQDFLSEEMQVSFIKYYVAIPKKTDTQAYEGKINYLEKLRNTVEIIEKPLKYIRENIKIEDKIISRIIKKGDVDVDITVDVLNNLKDLDIVIILSGDSDYLALRDDIIKKGKKILFMARKRNLSHEIRQGKYVILQSLKKYIIYTKGENETPTSKGGGTLVDILYSRDKKLSTLN